jgi:hypothetical protein
MDDEDGLLNRLDQWRKRQPDTPDRKEAARRLLEASLREDDENEPAMAPGRRVLNVIVSGLLTCAGIYLVAIWFFQSGARNVLLISGITILCVGCWWVYRTLFTRSG